MGDNRTAPLDAGFEGVHGAFPHLDDTVRLLRSKRPYWSVARMFGMLVEQPSWVHYSLALRHLIMAYLESSYNTSMINHSQML